MLTATAGKRVLLLGGTSEIGVAILERLAHEGPVHALLLGRDPERLAATASRLHRERLMTTEVDLIDADEVAVHRQVLSGAFERVGGFDLVVLAVGVLGAQAGLDADRSEANEVLRVNFVGAGSLLIESLWCLRRQGRGQLVVLSTVAGERVRASNAIYGAAKAGLDALAQGLADATAGSGVRVLVVRPGFVTTRMTSGLDTPRMSTTPQAVADATARALRGDAQTIWVPARLRLVFAVLRHLPRKLFRRISF